MDILLYHMHVVSYILLDARFFPPLFVDNRHTPQKHLKQLAINLLTINKSKVMAIPTKEYSVQFWCERSCFCLTLFVLTRVRTLCM